MSGGNMNYLSFKVEEAEFKENTPERRAFREHLKKVAEALHRIEWNDSGDGANGEEEAIRACLASGDVLYTLIKDARRVKEALQREINRAAGERGYVHMKEHRITPIDWLLGGDTGTSSKTICSVMTGSKILSYPDVPHDPGDFGRCYRLLALFPEWRTRLHEVAEQLPIWGPMVEAWDELTSLYEEERENENGKSPKLYARMRTLIDEGRIAAGWKKTGPGSWQGPNITIVEFGNK